ncbi:5'-3' exonuclease [Sinimarinibacterium sp. CAU 1509]|uniref:5'-3' exonuclease H3TH domain-containing protein n=1 Tax=Sinimarinibacterium sp. CAU 1509 TaxID=2562283 RepID=UPI0010AC6190|nr:5'-3' exonuclease H3TH domain-containing protein [Sinimarinibacterium sp. CAU 1509]TJY57214.1 5'-3' exonuclease [Sinimarinibacterium sp. CAU 1509]
MSEQRTPKLLVIDALNVVRRCHAANPAESAIVRAQDSVRSSIGSMRRALNEHAPTHAVAVFDQEGPTWRHALYPGYKASRKPMPPQLRAELPGLREQLESQLRLRSVSLPEVEADDVIASIVQRWCARDHGDVVVLSTDKDLCQLTTHGAVVRDHFKPEWRDAAWVQERYGVEPPQLGDLLALAGDGSDDIPGVPGVGETIAARLLGQFHTLDGVLEAASTLPGKLGERLREHAQSARLSRELVSFRIGPVGVCWSDLRCAATA